MSTLAARHCLSQDNKVASPRSNSNRYSLPLALWRESRIERLFSFGRDGKDAVWKLTIAQQLVVDHSLAVDVEGQSGEILQAKVPIPVDLGALKPGRQVSSSAGVSGEQRHAGLESDVLERSGGGRVRGQALLDGVHVDFGVGPQGPNITMS